MLIKGCYVTFIMSYIKVEKSSILLPTLPCPYYDKHIVVSTISKGFNKNENT